MSGKKRIALCLEYPLALRGGVSVLVETLLPELADYYELVLVSPDRAQDIAQRSVGSLLHSHLIWDPATVSLPSSQDLANRIAGAGVHLAHFHLGGVFGFGNRYPNRSPMAHLNGRGVPCCSSVHLVGTLLDGYCGPAKPWAFKLAMFPVAWFGKMHSLANVRQEVAVSRHNYLSLRARYFPMRSRFTLIYHSRLSAKTSPRPAQRREATILNVGHVAFRKGQPVLAEAFAQIAANHPDWKLELVGPIAEEAAAERIRTIARANGLERRILLPGSRDDVNVWMSRAGIYVQPSLAEALGLALQEAMFEGCPAIGTRVGGIPELVLHERTGLVVDPGSVAQLARALQTLIHNPVLRENYGRAGAAHILEHGFTREQMAADHIRIYESILKRP
jgi:glycosyltransferase involved in cell wall biosynthesis